MMLRGGLARLAFGSSLALALAGCSTIDLGDAGNLAQAGEKSGMALQTFYDDTRGALPSVLEIEVLRSTLQAGVSPPSPAMIASVERVRKSLALRAKIGSDLRELYSSFYELAATDYAGGFKSSVNDLQGSIGAFAAAIGETNPITPAMATAVGSAFGAAIKEDQKARVKKANAIILERLEQLTPLLEKDRQTVTLLREATARQVEQGGIALWKSGTVSAKPLLSRYANVVGLEPVDKETLYTYENVNIRETVPALITFRLNSIRDAEAARYEAMEDAVEELKKRHREIAEGAPMNLAALLARVEDLVAIKADIEAAFR